MILSPVGANRGRIQVLGLILAIRRFRFSPLPVLITLTGVFSFTGLIVATICMVSSKNPC